MRVRVGLLLLLVAMIGCKGRRTEIEAYEREVCACKDVQCVIVADAKFQSTLRTPQTWFERRFVSSGADRAMRESMRRADACAGAFRSSDHRCGGESGEECPAGYRCGGIDPSIPDGQGPCYRIPDNIAKSGERCGGPDKVGCEPGSKCMKTYRGEKSVERCVRDAEKRKEGDACTTTGGVDDCGPGLWCLPTQAGAITSMGECVKGKK